MSDVVISAENLGKKYLIGHQAENGRYVALRDVLMHNARTLWHKTKDLAQGKPIVQGDTLEEVWALKDVSFEIRRGEAVGIIGRNGAGKSTLLKVLSRITEPSAGRVTIKGRVASLLEVGTGFHPELTGRENIYLNGAILGMTRAEIKRKFDEIVAFAEVEKFLDTPVKRYSSGMYVRLAFAVAAHLEPEILVVDEVLAVGDVAFQKKCLGKMGQVAHEGQTVLFVSHSIPAIQSFCERSLLLRNGEILQDDLSSRVIQRYLNSTGVRDLESRPDHLVRLRKPSQGYRIVYFRIDTPSQSDVSIVQTGMDIDLIFGCQGNGVSKDAICSFVIQDSLGRNLLLQHNKLEGAEIRLGEHLSEISCRLKSLPLTAADYTIYVQLWVDGNLVDEANTETFAVEAADFFGTGVTVSSRDTPFLIRATWFHREVSMPEHLLGGT